MTTHHFWTSFECSNSIIISGPCWSAFDWYGLLTTSTVSVVSVVT